MSTKTFAKPTLTIDLGSLAANYAHFRDMGAAQTAAVVKADGYGLGIKPVVETLLEQGCRQFFVATPDEGAQVRETAEDAQIAVLGGLYRGAEDFYLDHHLIPVLNSLEEMTRWRDFSIAETFSLPCWLHVDTGMNRLGLGPDEWAALKRDMDALEPLHLIGIMSHFACADEKDHPLTADQAKRFAEAAREFPDALKSLCNSSGSQRHPEWHHDLLRPGYALYGGNPTPETHNPMRPVVALHAPILQIRNVRKGESAGYGAGHRFDQDTAIATLAIGYADGFLRSGSSRAAFYHNGESCPVLGRVSMDLVSIGIGHLAQQPAPGDMIEIIGPHQDIDALARSLGTIGYEILTALGGRYRREYIR